MPFLMLLYGHDGRHWDVLYDEQILADEDGLAACRGVLPAGMCGLKSARGCEEVG